MNFDQFCGICNLQGFSYSKYFDIESHTLSITLVHPVLVLRYVPATFYSAIFRVHLVANKGILGHKLCVN